ncbi:membrane-bound lytic murein transglycosylase B [Candidatus Kinetoplastibacterium blastocrithidii TCC012E]|uniref:Membrane-bound lytic murein transglycosylase B n=1 Tax=Candidatus Kinetoplastidibacterium blastocrithidiae TCC012E TaxID=1208922 RepID=M1M375_9PROT|nr:lytic murein transglycosylase [Candidatus Kinetoplastibacterium blastocrithidii]AFZ83895.1 peptidoglycan binding protein domain-containing protein 1 [Candidatus Kinetoplastibacterium blastocrithidii (ex Strigomonas culicis)]AGF49624.1 membrane-bound lytic murein transglycosylase B [Candidatus Kinetoplastibacterium blastocrithidii TCC012E]
MIIRYLVQLFLLVVPTACCFLAFSSQCPVFFNREYRNDCLEQLRKDAPGNNISYIDFDFFTKDVKILETTIKLRKAQPEVNYRWSNYISNVITPQRKEEGILILKKFKEQLEELSNIYNVDYELLVAVFGIETNYGKNFGNTNVLDAWFTRACTESNPLWKKNFYASIMMLRDGLVEKEKFIGSWSGAFGMTQFIPTSFYDFAVDADGDGIIDLYGSIIDALASTANHLKKKNFNWEYSIPAVVEVSLSEDLLTKIPIGIEFLGENDRRSFLEWSRSGVTRSDNKDVWCKDPNVEAVIFAPAGANGPIFLVSDNFKAILSYNRSRKYALAVSLLFNYFKNTDDYLRVSWPFSEVSKQ